MEKRHVVATESGALEIMRGRRNILAEDLVGVAHIPRMSTSSLFRHAKSYSEHAKSQKSGSGSHTGNNTTRVVAGCHDLNFRASHSFNPNMINTVPVTCSSSAKNCSNLLHASHTHKTNESSPLKIMSHNIRKFPPEIDPHAVTKEQRAVIRQHKRKTSRFASNLNPVHGAEQWRTSFLHEMPFGDPQLMSEVQIDHTLTAGLKQKMRNPRFWDQLVDRMTVLVDVVMIEQLVVWLHLLV